MSAAGTCLGCGRALRDAYLCRSCTAALKDALVALPNLIDNLIITAYRMDRVALTVATRSDVQELPFKPVAARLLADVRVHLLAFAVPDSDRAMCMALAVAVPIMAVKDPNVGRLYAVVLDDTATILTVIDLPISSRYLGRCEGCAVDMYADRAADVWVCTTPGCEHTYVVKERMAELIERARDVVAPTSTIATALTSLEYPVTEELIRKWVQRGLLTPRSNAGRQRWYRLGDVLDLILRQRTKGSSASGQ